MLLVGVVITLPVLVEVRGLENHELFGRLGWPVGIFNNKLLPVLGAH